MSSYMNKKVYDKIREYIESTWPTWKKKLCNDTLIISKNSKKLEEKINRRKKYDET